MELKIDYSSIIGFLSVSNFKIIVKFYIMSYSWLTIHVGPLRL